MGEGSPPSSHPHAKEAVTCLPTTYSRLSSDAGFENRRTATYQGFESLLFLRAWLGRVVARARLGRAINEVACHLRHAKRRREGAAARERRSGSRRLCDGEGRRLRGRCTLPVGSGKMRSPGLASRATCSRHSSSVHPTSLAHHGKENSRPLEGRGTRVPLGFSARTGCVRPAGSSLVRPLAAPMSPVVRHGDSSAPLRVARRPSGGALRRRRLP